jgi:hypothetical protein
MRDLPVRKVPGFGRVTERCLEGLGVEVSITLAELTSDLWGRLRQESRITRHGPLVWFQGLMVSIPHRISLIPAEPTWA